MVLNVKDANELEVIRFLTASAKVFAAIDNRPSQDLEQRDLDLHRNHFPARGFRVRQTMPTANASVAIDPGVWLNGNTIVQYAGATEAIPATTAGTIRIDLLWFDATAGAHSRTAGTPGAVAGGFAALARPNLPANTGGFPLAYVYVDETPTPFSRLKTLNQAGHIQDIRLAPGVPGGLGLLIENNPAVLATDVVSGAVGASSKIVRSDHRHPPNVDSTTPATIANVGSPGAPGTSTIYSRRDHVHALPASIANLFRLFDGVLNPTYDSGAVPLNAVTLFSALAPLANSSVVVPAGTFANGLIVVASVSLSIVWPAVAPIQCGVEMLVGLQNVGGLGLSYYLTDTPLVGGFTSHGSPTLGAPPLLLYRTQSPQAAETLVETVTTIGVWPRAGLGIGGGSNDFDGSFGDTHVTLNAVSTVSAGGGAPTIRVYSPSLLVFGF